MRTVAILPQKFFFRQAETCLALKLKASNRAVIEAVFGIG